MEVDFAALVVFEFLPQNRGKELHTSLTNLYGEEAKGYSGITFGGGSWQRQVYGNNVDNRLESDSEFKWIRTIVEQKKWGILDIATIAVLSDDQLTRIIKEEDGSSEYYQCRKRLGELLEDIPSIIDGEPMEKAMICYVEPTGKLDVWGEDGFDIEKAQETLEESRRELNRFNFTNSGYLSFVSNYYFVAPEILMQPWDKLVAVSRGLDIEEPTPDELVLGPTWYRELSTFNTYFRTFYWCEFRSKEIAEVDKDVDRKRDLLVSETSGDFDIDTVFDLASSNRVVSTRWVDLHTWLIDEIDGLRKDFRERADEAEDPVSGAYDIAIPRTESSGLVFDEDESNSLIELYEDQVREYLNHVESNIDRVNEKQQMLSTDIRDLVSVNATRENITLQNDMKALNQQIGRLTVILVGLTVILVVLTVILLIRPMLV